MKLFYTAATLALLSLAALRPAAAQTTVYSSNFTGGAGTAWSSQKTDTTPGTASHAADAFLGQFANQTVTLGLNSLATHSQVTVGFDLYIIHTMDGNGPAGGGPDPWSLNANGQTLISTNFANFPGDTQSFGGSNGTGGYLTGGNYAPQSGATEANTLGYGVSQDAVYHLAFTFNDASSALAFNFTSGQNQGLDDESWGLDNVVVQTNASPNAAPVPEASTVVSFSLLLALGAGSLTVRARRRHSSAA